jgi:hypothetical protein
LVLDRGLPLVLAAVAYIDRHSRHPGCFALSCRTRALAAIDSYAPKLVTPACAGVTA